MPHPLPRRLAATIAILLLFLAGCTGTALDLTGFTPDTAGPVRFGDRKPHPWDGRTPYSYPVHGVDVSRYQDRVDWDLLRANGISFAFIKATEGGDRVDERFREYWRGARAASIARGAYHFFYFCRPAEEQARWFIAHVPRERGALPPVLDMEWNPHSPTCRLRPPPETVRAQMRIFLDIIERHYGKKPIVYTTVDFYRDNDLGSVHGPQYWLRSVASHPDARYGRRNWTFWQYTGTGIVPGIEGDADLNVFRGSRADWRAWLARHAQ